MTTRKEFSWGSPQRVSVVLHSVFRVRLRSLFPGSPQSVYESPRYAPTDPRKEFLRIPAASFRGFRDDDHKGLWVPATKFRESLQRELYQIWNSRGEERGKLKHILQFLAEICCLKKKSTNLPNTHSLLLKFINQVTCPSLQHPLPPSYLFSSYFCSRSQSRVVQKYISLQREINKSSCPKEPTACQNKSAGSCVERKRISLRGKWIKQKLPSLNLN